jgi:Pyruvate/2-oxoacid:ferredoxin oxidoreductase gamma subunit
VKFEVTRQIYDRGEGNYYDYLVLLDGKIVAHAENEEGALVKLISIIQNLTPRTDTIN